MCHSTPPYPVCFPNQIDSIVFSTDTSTLTIIGLFFLFVPVCLSVQLLHQRCMAMQDFPGLRANSLTLLVMLPRRCCVCYCYSAPASLSVLQESMLPCRCILAPLQPCQCCSSPTAACGLSDHVIFSLSTATTAQFLCHHCPQLLLQELPPCKLHGPPGPPS